MTGPRMALPRWAWPALLAVPLIGLAGQWVLAHRAAQAGTEWLVPIVGFDPRDLLRGHYIQYRYAWPGLPEDPGFVDALCITGRAPTVAAARPVRDSVTAPAGCDAWVRTGPWSRTLPDGATIGRIYVAQTAAPTLERRLRDQRERAFVRVRIRDDGFIQPQELVFAPR